MVTVTLRPSAHVEIRGLPWRPGRANRNMILEAIEGSRSNQVNYGGGVFTVARHHGGRVIQSLAERFGQVHVIQYGGVSKCVSACWMGDEETVMDCVCSCAGLNHGSKSPHGWVVADLGEVGELSVSPNAPVEYDVLRGGRIVRN